MKKTTYLFVHVLVSAFILGAVASSSAMAQEETADVKQKIVGTWQVTSFESLHLESNEIRHPFGKNPIGYIEYSPGGHFVGFASAGNLPKPAGFPYTDAERAAIHKELFNAFSGTYRVEGNKIIQHILASFRPENIGTDSIRYVEVNGNKLTLKSAPIVGNRKGRKIVFTVTYERVE